MIGKRSELDFSKHELLITEEPGLLVHFLKKPGTSIDCIKYINTNGILAITGDYGNWIFCRELHPSPEESACDHYWSEKLRISSSQESHDFSASATEQRIKKLIASELEEWGYEDEQLEEMKKIFENCLTYLEDGEHPYRVYAYDNMPGFSDVHDIPCEREMKPWFKVVLDGFDEICRRLKDKQHG